MTTKVVSHRSVRIRVLERLWMPQCLAATSRDYALGSGPFQEHGIHTLDDVEQLMLNRTGDFSEVVDWEAVYQVSRHYPAPNGIGVVSHRRDVVAKPWQDPDHAWDWQDCMSLDED